MNGIRIFGEPTFRELFAPIFPTLHGLTWITQPDSFRLPLRWYDESSFDETSARFTSGPCAEFERHLPLVSEGGTRHGRYSTSNIFPEYADFVDEDWNAIYGLRASVDVAVDWMKRYFEVEDRVAHVSKAEVCFLNVDAAFWTFYAHDDRLITAVRRHLEELEVRVEACVLQDAAGYYL